MTIETIEAMRGRVAAALEPLFDPRAVLAGGQVGPSADPKHRFDFDNGLRLVVSRMSFARGNLIHVSASDRRLREIRDAMNAIGLNFEVSSTPVLTTGGGFPHWFWYEISGQPLTGMHFR